MILGSPDGISHFYTGYFRIQGRTFQKIKLRISAGNSRGCGMIDAIYRFIRCMQVAMIGVFAAARKPLEQFRRLERNRLKFITL